MKTIFIIISSLLVCGLKGNDFYRKRVIGGEIAPSNDYRWSVSIKGSVDELKLSGACGASILNTGDNIQWLLTAAHCFFPRSSTKTFDLTKPKLWHARIGLRKVDFNYEKHGLVYKIKNKVKSFFKNAYKKLFKNRKLKSAIGDVHVSKIFLHPNYNWTRLEYDIALMKLIDPLPVKEMEGINTIDLPQSDLDESWPPVGTECMIVGWGCTRAKGTVNEVAKLAKLIVWNNTVCEEAFKTPIDLNPRSEFCAGYLKKSYGLCPGDSGSGLACKHFLNMKLVGVTSAAHVNEPGEFPAIFTRVASFRKWIDKTIKEN